MGADGFHRAELLGGFSADHHAIVLIGGEPGRFSVTAEDDALAAPLAGVGAGPPGIDDALLAAPRLERLEAAKGDFMRAQAERLPDVAMLWLERPLGRASSRERVCQ